MNNPRTKRLSHPGHRRRIGGAHSLKSIDCITPWLVLVVIAIGSSYDCHRLMAQESPSVLSGLTDDEIFSIQDGRPLSANDPTLAQLLYRVSHTSETSLLNFSRHTSDVALEQVSRQPRDFRCYAFALQGRAQEVTPVETSELTSNFVLIRMTVAEEQEILVAIPTGSSEDPLPTIPKRWPLRVSIDEPVACLGFFMALCDLTSNQEDNIVLENVRSDETPVFVAPAVKWFPDSHGAPRGATASEQLLASQGVDITRLEAVRKNIIGTLGKQETASFYEMLRATQALTPRDLNGPKASLKDGLQKPRTIQAEMISVTGHVRKITKIVVDDPTIRSRYGIDQYYQLHMFAPLPDQQRVVIRPAPSNQRSREQTAEPIVHENRFPVAVCVVDLPGKEEDLLRRRIAIDGFFFKLWNYESELTKSRADSIRQISPLVIGLRPTVLEVPSNPLNSYIGIVATVFILGLIALVWYVRHEDQQPTSSSNSRDTLPEQIQISQVDGS